MTNLRVFRRSAISFAVLTAISTSLAGPNAIAASEVNIYSYREPKLVEPVLKAFAAKTGIKANMIFAKDGLIERMVAEGRNSPADLLLTNEFGLLTQAKAAGVTQPTQSASIDGAVPAGLRDPEGHWVGLTRRARIVYASKDRVTQDAITYEELADPKWKGKICVRSGQHAYNVALVASMIAHHGEEKARTWLAGVKANLARKPSGGDREAVRDVQAGLCDLAIGNTYYYSAMLKNPEQKAWAEAVKILFPNAADRGTHVNISGAAVAANAPNKANAVSLLEFLAAPEAQAMFADANGEYPVVTGVPVGQALKDWPPLRADELALSRIADLRKKASEMIDAVRFDAGSGG